MKIVIPAILATTVLVAGIFAFMPVQKASTVHTTITPQVVDLIQTGSVSSGTNLDDAPVTLMTADRSGIACFEVSVTDVGGGDDPAVDILVGGVSVASVNPVDAASSRLRACSPVAAADLIQVDQQGADVGTGNTVNSATAFIVGDTA